MAQLTVFKNCTCKDNPFKKGYLHFIHYTFYKKFSFITFPYRCFGDTEITDSLLLHYYSKQTEAKTITDIKEEGSPRRQRKCQSARLSGRKSAHDSSEEVIAWSRH